MQALNRWLREKREGLGLTMREVGERLGMPHTFVQKVETGERRLDVVEYVWYCEALDIKPYHGIDIVVDHLVARPPRSKAEG